MFDNASCSMMIIFYMISTLRLRVSNYHGTSLEGRRVSLLSAAVIEINTYGTTVNRRLWLNKVANQATEA